MNKFDQIKEKVDITTPQPDTLQIKLTESTTDSSNAEPESNPLEAADLFAQFTANIIKEERLFTR